MEDYILIGKNKFRRKTSRFLTQEYEVRNVGRFTSPERMVEALPNLMNEFASQGYVRIVKRESSENVIGGNSHWGLSPRTEYTNSLTLMLEKIKPSIKEEGFVKGGVFDSKTITLEDNGTISIDSDFWENPQMSLFPIN